MEKFLKYLRGVDWVALGFELGLGLFVLISFVRCAIKD